VDLSFTDWQILAALLLPVAYLHGYFNAKDKWFRNGIESAFETLVRDGKPHPVDPKKVIVELDID
jgi:hypothetical protein